jgi:uncharacterized protein YjaG (DUF416 family)
MADLEWRFEIDVDTPPEIQEGWAGGSGCPVFVGDQILGVVVTTLGKFAQKKLHAVAVWRLLDACDDFCRKVGHSTRAEREKQLEPYRRSIALELSATAAAREARDQLEQLAGVVPSGEGGPPERMARALLDLPDADACDALHTVFNAACETKRFEAAAAISRIANLVLPAVLDEQDSADIRASKGNAAHPMVPLHCYTWTLAELIMARCDRRKAEFRPLREGDMWSRGIHEIGSEPESGMHHSAPTDIRNFDMLLSDLCLSKKELEDYDEEERKDEIKRRIATLAKIATKYYTISQKDLSADPDLAGQIAAIKSRYPEIAFLRFPRRKNVRTGTRISFMGQPSSTC